MFCANNTILGNIVSKNIESGITMVNQCENNTVLGNTISNCGSLTMEIYASNNNKILENDVNNNVNGIWVMECNNITISDNTLNNIGYNGIYSQFCQNITISRNIIKNVNYRGINLENTGGSIIFINCFTNNIVNAFDVNINNQWDNGIKGNYWDDYTGIDENGDGIGDSPYVFGNIQDNFPLMECPLSSKEPNVIPLDLIISILSIGVGAAIILALLISNYRKKRRRTSGQK